MTCSRIRPIEIVARRNHEALCYLGTAENKDAEWLDVEDLDTDKDFNNIYNTSEDSPLPIIENLEDWITNPWMTE